MRKNRDRKTKRSSSDGCVEDHDGTRTISRISTPEVKRSVQAMKRKVDKLKRGKGRKTMPDKKRKEKSAKAQKADDNEAAKPKKTRVQLTDEQILQLVKEKKTCQQIMDETGVSQLTLKLRVGKLAQRLGKHLDVPGLFGEEVETIKFGKVGIRLSKAKLEGFGYKENDIFELVHDDKKKQLILTKKD